MSNRSMSQSLKYTGCILVLALLLLGLAANAKAATEVSPIYEKQDADLTIPNLVKFLNLDRMENGLHPLRRSADLDAAAQLKAADMIREAYFAHTSPAGVDPWNWFRQIDYRYIYAGENLALDFSDAAAVEKAWMESPKHRANILSENYEEVGYAISKGTFTNINGVKKIRADVVVIVQLFGKRIPVTTAAEPILSPAIPDSERVAGSEAAGISKVIGSLSAKLLSQNFSAIDKVSGESSETAGATPVSLPVLSLGLVILMTTAGFHGRFVV